jgi:hypothetical protein
MAYNYSQTFYVDPNTVSNSSIVFLNSVNLYFKAKPTATNNASGITNPGVSISITKTKSSTQSGSLNIPDFTNEYVNSLLRKAYADISISTTAATATNFKFNTPVAVETGKFYSINVKIEDPGYILWLAKSGDKLVGTNNPFAGFSGGHLGSLFDNGTDGTITPRQSTQLKFSVDVVKFLANTVTVEIANKDYEFLSVWNQKGNFIGGELVYEKTSNNTGTILCTSGNSTVRGVGTSFQTKFTTGSYFGIYKDGTNVVLRKVASIANSTSLTVTEPLPFTNSTGAGFFSSPVGKVYSSVSSANTLYLTESTANSTLYFDYGKTVIGVTSNASALVTSVDNFPVSQIKPEIGITIPSGGNVAVQYAFAKSNSTAYSIASAFNTAPNYQVTNITQYNSMIMSRSLEVRNPTYLYGSNHKSAVLKLVIKENGDPINGVYTSPYIYQEKIDIFSSINVINDNDYKENTRHGEAKSKHITTKVSFDKGKSAEDLLVYSTVYQPAGTRIEAYAKIHNGKDPEAFDDKDWTKLILIDNSNNQVSSTTSNNYVELTFGLPTTPVVEYTADGTVTTQLGNNIIVGHGTDFGRSEISNGDVIKIYSPVFPDQFHVAAVNAITNATHLSINSPIANTSLVGDGFVIDVVDNPQSAFLNIENSNVVRYYDTNRIEYDTYDTMQLKFLLLSSNPNVAPRIRDIRAIGVSA